MKKYCFSLFLLFSVFIVPSAAQEVTLGQPLPEWKEGYLDLHHINTGRGSCAYLIFPDGTTMLIDAGEMNPGNGRVFSARNAVIRPDSTKKPYEWIVRYIKKVKPLHHLLELDYALITHFHDDHFGSWYDGAPVSPSGNYLLSGITGVGNQIPIRHLLDRGYPQYDIPLRENLRWRKVNAGDSIYIKSMQNYHRFVEIEKGKGMLPAMFRAGSKTQVTLRYKPRLFPEFYVRNLKANGLIWTGSDSTVFQHFPPVDPDNPKTWPDENPLSLALSVHYGPFVYYTGGDNPGNISYGDAPWRDVETGIARALGEVDVAVMDHHGNRDAVNEFQVKTLKPRVWIGQTWSADHPGHEALIRMTTPYLYAGPRDLFSTNMLEANKIVIGPLIDRSYKSQQGHIVVRVLPGGNKYFIIILDDTQENIPVRMVFGPYDSKTKSK